MTTLAEQMKQLWQREIAIEPALDAASRSQVDDLRCALADLVSGDPYRRGGVDLPTTASERAELENTLAILLARAATIALAARDGATAARWLAEARDRANDPELRRQLEAACDEPERYRRLVHGRYLIAHDRERAARALWRRVARGKDALARAARDELAAPRPVRGMPTLYRINGIGAGFYGSRDRAGDGSYVTTHCLSFAWLPVIPLRAFRVRDAGGGYHVLAREQLSGFARLYRRGVLLAIAGAIAYAAVSGYANDPDRLARQRFAAALDRGSAEALDAELASPDLFRVDRADAERAGAAIVQLTADRVPEPLAPEDVEQAGRVVARYQALPERARGGEAREAMLAQLDRWAAAVRAVPDALLALLRDEAAIADPSREDAIRKRLAAARLAVARELGARDPEAALAVLVEDGEDSAAIAQAGDVLRAIGDKPALLDDARPDVERWLAHTGKGELEQTIARQLAAGEAARAAAEADDVTGAQLEAALARQPWNQRAALALARLDAAAGKLDAAAARLARFGSPGSMIVDGRILFARIAMEQGDLATADRLFAELLAPRLPRFLAASAALDAGIADLQARLKGQLDRGELPLDVLRAYEAAAEQDKGAVIEQWTAERMQQDPEVAGLRARYEAYAYVVPTAIHLGTVKLRRAQRMTGAARDAMLDAAERTFLAVRTQAEGEPAFRLGLGEIYARLGKTGDSERELGAVLAMHDAKLSLAVAEIYRGIGKLERAEQVASAVYDSAPPADRQGAAHLMALLTEDEPATSESWLRKCDQHDPTIQIALLELEARELLHQGKLAACAAKFAEVANRYLATASAGDLAGYNNAAVADGERFECSGDLSALAAAESALEQADKLGGDQPIVVGNLARMLDGNAVTRALARRADLRGLRLRSDEAGDLAKLLLDGPERDATLAAITADPAWRRSYELAQHYEVLAPSSTDPYSLELSHAATMRDAAGAAAVIDRLQRAKAIDTSRADAELARWLGGSDDDRRIQQLDATIAGYQELIDSGQLAPHARAAALYLEAIAIHTRALYWPDPARMARVIEINEQAARLWPALDREAVMAHVLLDQAGVRIAPARWSKLRRERSAAAILDQLSAAGDPLASKLRAAPEWPQIVAHMKAAGGTPDADDLRLARQIGDPAIVRWANAALDDKLGWSSLQLAAIAMPSAVAASEDLAYLAKR